MEGWMDGISHEHFIPQMQHVLRKKPLIMWLWWRPAESITQRRILFTLWNLSALHPSFLVCLPLYLICSSPTCLPLFLVPLQPLPSQLLYPHPSLLAFFPPFLSTRVLSRDGEQEQDGLRRWARHWLSFVFLICFIRVGRKSGGVQRQYDKVWITSVGRLSNLFQLLHY